jgi:hypothetical protein
MSSLQSKLDEKKRQHQSLQFQMQDLAVQDHNHLNHLAAPAASALMPPPPYPGNGGGNPLPDFRNLSLEDADWFHEGIPR